MNAKAQMNALRSALRASQALTAALGDISGGVGLPTVPGLYQDYLPPDLRGAPKDLFWYRVDILAVAAAGGTGQGAFTVQSDSDFEFCYLTASVTDPAAPEIARVPDGFGPSDHASFYGQRIPVLAFFTGAHDEYHRPGDDLETIDAEGEVLVAGDEATAEARRCLSCGVCTECGNCAVFCPDAAVRRGLAPHRRTCPARPVS